MTPVICLLFTFVIKELATEQLPSGNQLKDLPYPYVFDDSSILDQTSTRLDKNGSRILDSPSRNIPLQWYIYECVDKCPSSTLLGEYNGDTAQSVADGKTVLGSVVNDPSQSM